MAPCRRPPGARVRTGLPGGVRRVLGRARLERRFPSPLPLLTRRALIRRPAAGPASPVVRPVLAGRALGRLVRQVRPRPTRPEIARVGLEGAEAAATPPARGPRLPTVRRPSRADAAVLSAQR